MSAVLILALAVSAMLLVAWRADKTRTTFGSAAWMRPWEASRYGFFRKKGILIGDWCAGFLPVYYRGSGHILHVAPTGMGKGAHFIANLLLWNRILLIDPGGESTAVAVREWRRQGYAFGCLNPWGMHGGRPWSLPTHGFNPLDWIDPRSETFINACGLVAEMIILRTGRDDGSTVYFKAESESAIRAFIVRIKLKEPPERQNLLTLREYITSDRETWDKLLDDMMAEGGDPARDLMAREAAQLRRREDAPEELSAIVSTMKQDTNFLDDPVMQRALSRSDFDLAMLKGHNAGGQKGAVVSVVIPLENLETHAAFLRLIVGAAILTMQRPPLAKGRVLFLLDEFAALGKITRISKGLATLRKYRVWLYPVVQNIAQLTALYGAEWQTFCSNAECKLFQGAWEPKTAEYVSKLCGRATVETTTRDGQGRVSRGEGCRDLLTPEEVMHRPENRLIAFIGNRRPMDLRVRPYWKRPLLQGRFERNPYYHGRTPGPDPLAPVAALYGLAYRFAAWLVRPAPAVVLAAAYALAVSVNLGVYHSRSAGLCQYFALAGAWEAVRADRDGTCRAARPLPGSGWAVLNGHVRRLMERFG